MNATLLPASAIATPLSYFVTGASGNVMGLVVMYTMRSDVKKTAYYVLLVGLAWTNLLGQVLSSPVVIAVYANRGRWVGGIPLCLYHAFVMVFFGTITPILVCLLACERFFALICTYSYSRLVTLRSVKISFVVCWLGVLLFSCLPFMGFGSFARQYPGTWCFFNYHNESRTDSLFAYMFSGLNVGAIFLIIVLNTSVCLALLRMRRRRLISTVMRITNVNGNKSESCMEVETQMVVFLCIISLVFFVCWMPLSINIMVNLYNDINDHTWDLRTIRLASFCQILDPWMYVLLRKSVLHKIYRFVKTQVCKSDSLKEKVCTAQGAETRLLRANLKPLHRSLEMLVTCQDGGYVKVGNREMSSLSGVNACDVSGGDLVVDHWVSKKDCSKRQGSVDSLIWREQSLNSKEEVCYLQLDTCAGGETKGHNHERRADFDALKGNNINIKTHKVRLKRNSKNENLSFTCLTSTNAIEDTTDSLRESNHDQEVCNINVSHELRCLILKKNDHLDNKLIPNSCSKDDRTILRCNSLAHNHTLNEIRVGDTSPVSHKVSCIPQDDIPLTIESLCTAACNVGDCHSTDGLLDLGDNSALFRSVQSPRETLKRIFRFPRRQTSMTKEGELPKLNRLNSTPVQVYAHKY